MNVTENTANTPALANPVENHNSFLGDNYGSTGSPTPYYIAFTLSADPGRKHGKYYFHELSPHEQKGIYYHLLKDMFMKFKDKQGYRKMIIHYELDKSKKIHCHGYVDCKETIVGYDIPLLDIQSYCHKRIGRLGNKMNVSSYMKWIDGKKNNIEEWIKYCDKENSLPKSKIITHKITDYCTKGQPSTAQGHQRLGKEEARAHTEAYADQSEYNNPSTPTDG